ncbi:MAG: CerR family C-terminal domain-containing protein, partial [Alphaproteobacteria bacterium]|nr:CerR family C-terminal domain-containing protein [Alphaproteobacteria bacterium]
MARIDKRATVQRSKRRPRKCGYACGDETRMKIILAALEVFGARGFDGASTRMVAKKARVNLPALQYYFNGKEGVYLACADYIAGKVEERLLPAVEGIMHTLGGEEPSRQWLLDTLLGFLDEFTDLFVGDRELDRWILFICREQAQPSKACDIIFQRVMSRVARTCTLLVSRLLDLPDGDPRATVRALGLLGQILFFRLAREAPLRVLRWKDFEAKHLVVL